MTRKQRESSKEELLTRIRNTAGQEFLRPMDVGTGGLISEVV